MDPVAVRVVDEYGNKEVCHLLCVEKEITLENLRKIINQQSSYDFIYKNVFISQKQEGIVRLKQIARAKHDDEVEILVRLKPVEQPNCPTDACTRKRKKPSSDHPDTQKNKARVFTDEEINKAEGLEREKRTFWNSLAAKLEKHPVYGAWSVQEKHGILDTEWTLKFTELLKVKADERLLECNDEYQRGVAKNIDKLKRADFERQSCYNRIERLNKVTIKTEEIRANIKKEENCLHDLFTELKVAQSDLSKCLSQRPSFKKESTEEMCSDFKEDHSFAVENVGLTTDEVNTIAAQTKAENDITCDI